MRASVLTALLTSLTALGCLEHESASSIVRDPSTVETLPAKAAEQPAPRPSATSPTTVRCGCDADGNLHVTAPAGAKVSRPEGSSELAEAQIVLPAETSPRPIRVSRSLGFIGDAPLTPSRSHGGPWNAPDALLPKHTHGSWSGGYGYGYGYGHGYRSFQPSFVSTGVYPRPYVYR